MSDSRKQPSVTWLCVTVVVALPVAYFLSLGPLLGILVRVEDHLPAWSLEACTYYIAPGGFAYEHSPRIAQDALRRYVELFDK